MRLLESMAIPAFGSINAFAPIFKRRFYDTYVSEWRVCTRSSPSVIFFNSIKQHFGMAEYLTLMENNNIEMVLRKYGCHLIALKLNMVGIETFLGTSVCAHYVLNEQYKMNSTSY
jgi:hypothetical protein